MRSAASGQVLEWSGTAWAPATDNGTAYTAGAGINIAGSVINNSGDTDATNDVLTTTTFGGDVSGVYTNIQLAANSVGSTEISNDAIGSSEIANDAITATEIATGAVTTAEILDATILAADLNQMSATSGQVLKWNGSAWAPAVDNGGGGSGWELTGNAGTNPTTNFVGTTDNQPLSFRVNNLTAGFIDITTQSVFLGANAGDNNTAMSNTFIGNSSGFVNTTGDNNTGVGSWTLIANTTGLSNTAVGSQALRYSNGSENVAMGYRTLYHNTTGNFNTGLGRSALFSNTTGGNNVAVGRTSLFLNTEGIENIAIGMNASYSNTTGSSNIAIGHHALYNSILESGTTAIGHYAMANMKTLVGDNESVAVGFEALKGSDIVANNTGKQNTAVGYQALTSITSGKFNTAMGISTLGSNTVGTSNTANGYHVLYSNTTGEVNTAFGREALYSNINGDENTANGAYALYYNTNGDGNTANGISALSSNVAGDHATAIGYRAMLYANNTATAFENFNVAVGAEALRGSFTAANNTGNNNTALGYHTLYNNESGGLNTATGRSALIDNTTGTSNTANGYQSLFLNTTGSYNSGLGRNSYFDNVNLDNTTSLGYNAGGVVEASNRVEIGNTSVNVIAGQVAFSTYSDKRIKDNIKEDVPGLNFIKKLRPVTYNLNIHRQNEMVYLAAEKDSGDWESKYDIEKIKMTGFLAQEVEQAAKESGYDFSGVQVPENPDDLYSLRYSDFVMPLVKAVQELNLKVELLEKENAQLEDRNEELKMLAAQNATAQTLADQQKLISALQEKLQLLEHDFHTKN